MNKFVAVVFPDQKAAYEGVRGLQELHREGSVTVYATAVVQRNADGTLTQKQRSDEGALGSAVGALVGALVGMLGGPIGVVSGAVAGGTAGAWRDYLHSEVSEEYLDVVQKEMSPGKCAVIAEVAEEWNAPIDARMEAIGGRVLREPRAAFVDELFQRRVDARRTELDQRRAEKAGIKAGKMEARLLSQIDDAQRKLDHIADKARQRLDEVKLEMKAKLHSLEAQAAQAPPDIRKRIEARIVALRKDFEEREQKLTRALELTKEATHA